MTTMNFKGVVMAAALVVGGGPALADGTPKEVQNMQCLVGEWKATGTVQMGADKADIKGTWSCKRISADWGVQCGLTITGVPGMGKYQEMDLFGFDPGARKYHWFSVTNAGETHDHVAEIPTSNTIEFVYNGTQEGKPFKEVIKMTFNEKSTAFDLRAETFLDGKSTSVFSVNAKK